MHLIKVIVGYKTNKHTRQLLFDVVEYVLVTISNNPSLHIAIAKSLPLD